MVAIRWQDVVAWCVGMNNTFGTCFFAMFGNYMVIKTGQVMTDGEILNADHAMTGFNDYDSTTDHGEALETGFKYIQANGWPGDTTWRITGWRQVQLADLANTIASHLAAPSWLMLPKSADGDSYDFSDNAMLRNADGAFAHAVLIVDVTATTLTFVTWGETQTVSLAWAARYFKGFYEVDWNDTEVLTA